MTFLNRKFKNFPQKYTIRIYNWNWNTQFPQKNLVHGVSTLLKQKIAKSEMEAMKKKVLFISKKFSNDASNFS